jgi:hypothetical protein
MVVIGGSQSLSCDIGPFKQIAWRIFFLRENIVKKFIAADTFCPPIHFVSDTFCPDAICPDTLCPCTDLKDSVAIVVCEIGKQEEAEWQSAVLSASNVLF